MANVMDFLSSYRNTVVVNPSISALYVFYQFVLIISSVLGPATIELAIALAIQSVFNVQLLEAYTISMLPMALYIVICLYMNTKYQLLVGAVLSVTYAAIMMVVLVGIIQTIVINNILSPSLLFLVVISASFFFAGIIHPYEFTALTHGVLFFLCIPAGYLIIIIYSLCNLHVVSWGTREAMKRKIRSDQSKLIKPSDKELHKKQGLLAYLRLDVLFEHVKEMLTHLLNTIYKNSKAEKFQTDSLKTMRSMNKNVKILLKVLANPEQKHQYLVDLGDESDDDGNQHKKDGNNNKDASENLEKEPNIHETNDSEDDEEEIPVKLDSSKNPNWIKHPGLGQGKICQLSQHETQFWKDLIQQYLHPITMDENDQKQLQDELISLRNNASFGFWFVNFLWVLFNFMIQKNPNLNEMRIGSITTYPLGFLFLIFFLIVLFLQILGMLIHRCSTFLQLISITELSNPWSRPAKGILLKKSSNMQAEAYRKLLMQLSKGNTFLMNNEYSAEDENIYCQLDHMTMDNDHTQKPILNNHVYKRQNKSGKHYGEIHINLMPRNDTRLPEFDRILSRPDFQGKIKQRHEVGNRDHLRRNFQRQIHQVEAESRWKRRQYQDRERHQRKDARTIGDISPERLGYHSQDRLSSGLHKRRQSVMDIRVRRRLNRLLNGNNLQ